MCKGQTQRNGNSQQETAIYKSGNELEMPFKIESKLHTTKKSC